MAKGTNKHFSGVDYARITAGFMVVAIHNLWWGGVLRHYDTMDWDWAAAWYLEAMVIVAVNLFGLISGYLLIHHQMTFKKLRGLWWQALAMGSVMLLLVGLWQRDVWQLQYIAQTLFPFSARTYWYFSAYVFLYLLLPFLNAGIQQMDKRLLGQITVTLLVIAATVGWQGNFFLRGGFTGAWLIILYLVGAYWRLYGLPWQWSKRQAFAIYLGATSIGWAATILPPLLGYSGISDISKPFLSYLSPTVVIASVALFAFFLQLPSLQGRPASLVKQVSPLMFAVFLLNRSPAFWYGVLEKRMQYASGRIEELLQVPTVVGVLLLTIGMFVGLTALAWTIMNTPTWAKQVYAWYRTRRERSWAYQKV
jgi:surface polysaccharide O-acyltransferase-like enzyme